MKHGKTIQSSTIFDREVTTCVVKVTPEVAAQWLKTNTKNRPVREAHVLRLARQMTAGLWQVTSDAIAFNTEGRMTDGQHRLWAVIRSGCTVQMLVASNLDASTLLVENSTALGRRPSDLLHLNYECKNAVTVASGILTLHRLRSGLYRKVAEQLYQGQYDNYYETFPELEYWASHATARRNVVPASLGCGLGVAFALSEKHSGDADLFFDGVNSGANLATYSPMLQLRNRLLMNQAAKEKMSSFHIGEYIIKAWNYYWNGKMIKNLYIRPGSPPLPVKGFDATVLPYYRDDLDK